jgi:hypothetical protein
MWSVGWRASGGPSTPAVENLPAEGGLEARRAGEHQAQARGAGLRRDARAHRHAARPLLVFLGSDVDYGLGEPPEQEHEEHALSLEDE